MSMKNLKIDESTHTRLKVFCAERKLKINAWVDQLIISELDKKNGKSKPHSNVPKLQSEDHL